MWKREIEARATFQVQREEKIRRKKETHGDRMKHNFTDCLSYVRKQSCVHKCEQMGKRELIQLTETRDQIEPVDQL